MRNSLLVAYLLVACSSSKSKPPLDQAEDSGPRTYLVATDEALASAFKKATGHELGKDCIHRPEALAEVIVLGSFASDRGCMPIGAFVKGQWLSNKSLLKSGLATFGWEAMSMSERDTLATPWIEEVILTYRGSRFLGQTVPAFEFPDTPAFAPLISRRSGEAIMVGGWTALPGGMIFESSYAYSEFAIAPSGAISARSRATFGVPGARLHDSQLK